MVAAGDITGDLHVVGLVGQDAPGGRVPLHNQREPRVGRIAANDAMGPEPENVAKAGDCDAPTRLQRPLLQRLFGRRRDLIDLGR